MTETKTDIERLLTHLKDGSLAMKLSSAGKSEPSSTELAERLKNTLADRVGEIRSQFDDRDD